MPRKRIKHEQISNESRRNATFGKRLDGFFKKANELSILCGVDVGTIVHKHGEENNTTFWPSQEVFRQRLERYLDAPYLERTRRMVTHEEYLNRTVRENTADLLKTKNKIQLKEARQLTVELTKGRNLEDLDLSQLYGLNSFAEEMLEKIQKRGQELNNNINY